VSRQTTKCSVRPATREDIEAFSPLRNKPTIKALAMECDGKIIGLAGYALVKGRYFGFCDLHEEARQYKMHIARAARRFLKAARDDGIKFIYAEADPEEPGAVRWLTSLGFTVDPRTSHLLRWKGS
jgi:hypothetical protein